MAGWSRRHMAVQSGGRRTGVNKLSDNDRKLIAGGFAKGRRIASLCRSFGVSKSLVEAIIRRRIRCLIMARDNAKRYANPEHRKAKIAAATKWNKEHPQRRAKIESRYWSKSEAQAKRKRRMQVYYRGNRARYYANKRRWEKAHPKITSQSSCRRAFTVRQECRRHYLVKLLRSAGRAITTVNIKQKRKELQLWRTQQQFRMLAGGAVLSRALSGSSRR